MNPLKCSEAEFLEWANAATTETKQRELMVGLSIEAHMHGGNGSMSYPPASELDWLDRCLYYVREISMAYRATGN